MGTPKANPLRAVKAVLTGDVAALMDAFMLHVEAGTEDDDWEDTDNWLGRVTLKRQEGDQTFIYHVMDGKMVRTQSDGPYIASIVMSVQTFLDIMEAALQGKGEDMWVDKYGAGRIVFQGDRWVADSERFRKILRRMGR